VSTAQDAFNAVWDWFVVQGRPASIAQLAEGCRPTCAYRGDGGARCAAGVLLDDRDYAPHIEGGAAVNLDATHSPLLAAALGHRGPRYSMDGDPFDLRFEGLWLADGLQRCHDRAHSRSLPGAVGPLAGRPFREVVEAHLREAARFYALQVPA